MKKAACVGFCMGVGKLAGANVTNGLGKFERAAWRLLAESSL